MNRRAFFGLIAAAIGLPHLPRQYWRIRFVGKNKGPICLGEMVGPDLKWLRSKGYELVGAKHRGELVSIGLPRKLRKWVVE